MQRLRRCAAWGLLATTWALTMGAVSAQTTVQSGFNLFSTDQDIEIGRRSAAEVERQLPLFRDPSVEAYVGAIGKRLAAVIPGATFPYQFKVVNASDIDAFAFPGGYVYLSRGLIEAVHDEGQLAGVLAHEMAHVALRHGTHQASKAYLGQAGLGMLGGLMAKDDDSTERVMGAVGGFGLNALFLKFSRADEEQADIVGAQTMAKAGYDVQDMIDLFEVLRAKQAHAHQGRAARIRSEMAMLTIRPTAPVGGFQQAKATLRSMPAARPMPQRSQDPLAPPPPPADPGPRSIAPPSSTFLAFEPRNRLFRIEYPSNWRSHESADGLGVILAPPGGFVDSRGEDLIYGVVIHHYVPFLSDAENSRVRLPAATNDLVGQIVRSNPTLSRVPASQRSDTIDGTSALSLVLSGRSLVTGQEERVTVFTRELGDDHVVYALFIAPGQDYGQLEDTFARMMGSLSVTDTTVHR